MASLLPQAPLFLGITTIVMSLSNGWKTYFDNSIISNWHIKMPFLMQTVHLTPKSHANYCGTAVFARTSPKISAIENVQSVAESGIFHGRSIKSALSTSAPSPGLTHSNDCLFDLNGRRSIGWGFISLPSHSSTFETSSQKSNWVHIERRLSAFTTKKCRDTRRCPQKTNI